LNIVKDEMESKANGTTQWKDWEAQFISLLLTGMWGAQNQSLLHCWEKINTGFDYLLRHRLYVAYPRFVLPEHLLFRSSCGICISCPLWCSCLCLGWVHFIIRVFFCTQYIFLFGFYVKALGGIILLTFNISFCIVFVSLPYLIRTLHVSPQRVFWYVGSIHWHLFRFLLTLGIHWLISVIIQASKQ